MAETSKLIVPENLQGGPGFIVMKDFMISMFGADYLSKVTKQAKKQMAVWGDIAWSPSDANMTIDVSPMPDPWKGQWGYRIRFCSLRDGDVCVAQFYVPQCSLPKVTKHSKEMH